MEESGLRPKSELLGTAAQEKRGTGKSLPTSYLLGVYLARLFEESIVSKGIPDFMQKQRVQLMAALWSEFLALWFDRTRRRALPLLLAALLLLIPSLPAPADCSCEVEGSSPAHHHHDGEEHEHPHAALASVASFTPASSARGHLAVLSQGVAAQLGASFCSCPRAPVSTSAVSAVGASSQPGADGQNLVCAGVTAPAIRRVICLIGLFGRAGPPSESKPQLLSLSSLVGRAPPVSL